MEDELFQYLPIGGFVGFLFLLETFFCFKSWFYPFIIKGR
jgi:hypothetical protein